MSLDAMERAVRDWHERMTEISGCMQALDELVGVVPESPLSTALWAMNGGYMGALDAAWQVGGWLEWWWLECDLGARPKEAKLGKDAEFRKISTIDDLVQLLRDEQAGTA